MTAQKIRVPFRLEDGGVIGEGVRDIGPGDPDYAAYAEWLDARAADAPDTWTVAGEIPDTGQQATITWRDGIEDCPPDALDWLIAAANAGEVDASDGARLLAWLKTQGFTEDGGS